MRIHNLRPAGTTPRASMLPALHARLLDLHILFIKVKIRRALPLTTSLGDKIEYLITQVEEIPSLPPPMQAHEVKKACFSYSRLRAMITDVDEINAAGAHISKAAWKIAQRIPAGAADEH